MLELAVNCLGVVVFFVITDDRLSGVILDTTIEHRVDKALLLFKKRGTVNSRRDVGAIKDITDVMRASLRNYGTVPVVPMLVILEDRISVDITTDTPFEVMSSVGCCTDSRAW